MKQTYITAFALLLLEAGLPCGEGPHAVSPWGKHPAGASLGAPKALASGVRPAPRPPPGALCRVLLGAPGSGLLYEQDVPLPCPCSRRAVSVDRMAGLSGSSPQFASEHGNWS